MFGFGPVFSAKIVCKDGVSEALKRGGARARAEIYKAVLKGAALVQRRAKLNVKTKFGHPGKEREASRMARGRKMRAENRKAKRLGHAAPHSEADIRATRGPSGTLAHSIIVKGNQDKLQAVVGPTIIYGRIHELGGVIRPRRKRLLSWIDPDTGERVFAKKVTIPKRPYLAPAADVSRPQVKAIIEKAVARWAKDTEKGGGGSPKTTSTQTGGEGGAGTN